MFEKSNFSAIFSNIYTKLPSFIMLLVPDYDEFNIYTSADDVENYVEQLFSQGYELKEEIYSLCLKHFGNEFKDIIDIFFEYEN